MLLDDETEARIAGLLVRMTLEEKAAMTAGADMWHSVSVPRLGIPAFKMSDGPNGVRGDGMTQGATSLNLPGGSVLGASWNPALLRAVGDALGQEARDKDVQVVLGPTINLQRLPVAGRNFECYSEDPLLTSELASAFVQGLQAHDVAACVKHYVGNEYERERQSASSEIDGRALHELYLAPFEAAVRAAGVWSVMSAYNKVNGEYASSSRYLLTDVLRRDWGFDGVVISDWTGTYAGAPSASAGLDLEMPGPARHMGPKLVEAVRAGALAESVVDEQVRRLLRLLARTGRLQRSPDDQPAEISRDRPEHRALARRALHEGMVLLRNDGALPLREVTRVALIGPNAVEPQYQGGGSSVVRPHHRVSALEALSDAFGANNVDVARGCDNHRYIALPDPRWCPQGWRVRYFAGFECAGEVLREHTTRRPDMFWFGRAAREVPHDFSATLDAELHATASGTWHFSLMNAGKARLYIDDVLVIDNWRDVTPGDSYIGMGSTEVRGEFVLQAGHAAQIRVEYAREGTKAGIAGVRIGVQAPIDPREAEEALLAAVQAARQADAAIVIVGLTPDWESEGFDRGDIELPGRQVDLIRAVAAVNARTVVVINAGSGIAVAAWAKHVAAILHVGLPGQAFGDALVDVLCGKASPSGRLAFSVPFDLADAPGISSLPPAQGRVPYDEGIDIGYRGYQRAGVMPALPFGFGLTYGRFEYADLGLSANEFDGIGSIEVRCTLTNVGERDAAEVAQLYLTAIDDSGAPRADMAIRALAAFVKVHVPVGEARQAVMHVSARRFSRWLPGVGWQFERGRYRIEVGANVASLRLRASVRAL